MDTPRPPTSSIASFKPEPWASELWGERDFFNFIEQYESRFCRHEGDWEPKPIEELACCISMIRNDEHIGASELEVLMRASRTWQLFDELTSEPLDLIRSLMDSLHHYCEEGNLVFDHYYGLFWVQLLSAIVVAGVINGSDKRESTLEFIRVNCANQIDMYEHVVAHGVLMMSRAMGSKDEDNEERIKACFVEKHQRNECTILPALGGFNKEDAEFLLKELWDERDSFFLASSKLCWQGTPGWSAILAVIWYHIRHINDSTLSLQRLRNLTLRYSISAARPETFLLRKIVQEIENEIPVLTPGIEELPPVDESDVKFMVTIYMSYLGLPLRSAIPDRAPSDLTWLPFFLVYRNTLTTLPDRLPSLLTAVMERVWTILEESSPNFTLQERILNSFEYAVDVIQSMCIIPGLPCSRSDEMIEATTVVWTEFLGNVNIVELIGRLCSMLVISTGGSGSEFLICSEDLKEFSKRTRDLMSTLQDVIQVQTLGNLNELGHAWHKVLMHIENQLLFYPPGGPVQYRANLCKSVWLEVGKTFGFLPQAPRQHQCMNPRCPIPYPEEGARHICTRCCWVHYCSQRCQALRVVPVRLKLLSC
ncbi:unnamed protein product [Rhizoctonia solani]|uniref:MYND-type domain-containing protein n=1 Tax=Rhizoctonia solani TaxID=456999 RepID=A0A8H3DUF4_9AGAM|nr:unnamed protein product [Rhizoctonia solani]